MNNRRRLIKRAKRMKGICRHKYSNGILSITTPDENGYCKCVLCGEEFKMYTNHDIIKGWIKYE